MKPIAISCGEPAGIGPEIAAAAWDQLRDQIPLLWIGDPAHLPAGTPYQTVTDAAEAASLSPNALPVLAQDFGPMATAGVANPAHAQGVIDAIATGVALTRSGMTRALCTAPINKAALINGADFPYPGHTEYLAALADTDQVVMMLACDALRVVPTTIHIPLNAVATQLTASLLTDTLLITHAALRRDFGIAVPRIAVAGLNPHAGEDGKMGQEEIDMIAPVLTALRAQGMDVTGPLPADTMFHAGARAKYDVAVCMYHDQALIPIKTLDFSGGVNVTLGLPFIRTSPDHGTAFDIAGQGVADPTSMIAAIKMAATMADSREQI
ncbi:4-hydroxythreonine-4-phosphate dehydrogenase PdxA [Loktanella sp. D2R18]|uniref:4-hydroxythreonine-4-phosphate dehydrogenase PdxA n=1 Tax=Rhodobacterales TaxID=204455 RepID=UPI000DE8C8D0|nr:MULTISPECIES: 4-hydroxythreonine-4-phosphate dehydrogenase PdxA [Rhodobacterales]MDO6589627.1 4-hydroxythreonine-4-phosphate dehydrogenase PdxA [Yoonia sp. 1_MG-2023]RBW44262.1 4-hydroxythreonine-4-phosphate dehydrogenase PdxA [Loktanella sp. D2R18]